MGHALVRTAPGLSGELSGTRWKARPPSECCGVSGALLWVAEPC